MQHYLILQYPYNTIQIALCQNSKIIQEITEHKFNAIRATIPNIQALLNQHNLKLQNISCIGVNVGPGPYNTLRAVLTMANGIHFASKIPLISFNALQLLKLEIPMQNSLIMLHAFLDHVFYLMTINNKITEGGCHISELIKLINQQKTSALIALGNGAEMHKQLLMDQCKDLIFPDKISEFNTLQTLSEQTYEKLKHKNFENSYVQPIYFQNLTKK